MGRRIQGQRRGRGTSTFRAPSHRYKAELSHKKSEEKDTITGTVVGIEHDPARSAPIALVEFEDEQRMILAPEGVTVGEELQIGVSAEIKPGNTLPLAEIPEGVPVCNVEHQPGDGGKFARASGVSAQLLSHDRKVAIVKLPSGEVKRLNPNCRATIGVVAGGGRTEKPFVKAGKKYHKMKARGIKWPRVRGVAMNAVDHPFGGGGRQHPGQPKSVSRNAPPGRKVGDIASKRTGRGGKGGK
ncbi:50S ribosomal protein L2 [Haloferax sp. Atlit-12N]|uniref:Large ribosomal subunit protein uL2 n=3 Tax=Haloferax TaxID=2251 RepID=A0A0K1IVT3_HALGI|nr:MULTISPECIES: 50S ribosomal protein L2 [Haloferax]AKU08576.1 50S ribosomal protein L2 [Haloferax gibbonsii]ELZ67018.1 50S ribosomal protein L2P [Haloferax prahovense DSM 18310]ELZ81297.1 50S ribosomal protein L2P [Haloferax gibbonsii ATCC 33959]MCO8266752.1 50S ribosomal protein L2 [Haloferax sp. AB510]QOS12263.1 50S ribosomal protein L2 [Haloferax gibbonsii]